VTNVAIQLEKSGIVRVTWFIHLRTEGLRKGEEHTFPDFSPTIHQFPDFPGTAEVTDQYKGVDDPMTQSPVIVQ